MRVVEYVATREPMLAVGEHGSTQAEDHLPQDHLPIIFQHIFAWRPRNSQ